LTAAVALTARVVLSATFVYSAIAKLRARGETRNQMVALLGPSGRAFATSMPFVELAVAVGLIAWWSAVPGIVAVVVLLTFTGVLVRAQIRRLPCPCFGGGIRPVGSGAILRNAVLVSCAVLATGSPHVVALIAV
jgi:hypothetical protein